GCGGGGVPPPRRLDPPALAVACADEEATDRRAGGGGDGLDRELQVRRIARGDDPAGGVAPGQLERALDEAAVGAAVPERGVAADLEGVGRGRGGRGGDG